MEDLEQQPTTVEPRGRTEGSGADPLQLDTVDPIREQRALGGVLERMLGTAPAPERVGRYVLDRRLVQAWLGSRAEP